MGNFSMCPDLFNMAAISTAGPRRSDGETELSKGANVEKQHTCPKPTFYPPSPPVVPFFLFWGEGSPTKIDCRTKGALILTSLLEELVVAYMAVGQK